MKELLLNTKKEYLANPCVVANTELLNELEDSEELAIRTMELDMAEYVAKMLGLSLDTYEVSYNNNMSGGYVTINCQYLPLVPAITIWLSRTRLYSSMNPDENAIVAEFNPAHCKLRFKFPPSDSLDFVIGGEVDSETEYIAELLSAYTTACKCLNELCQGLYELESAYAAFRKEYCIKTAAARSTRYELIEQYTKSVMNNLVKGANLTCIMSPETKRDKDNYLVVHYPILSNYSPKNIDMIVKYTSDSGDSFVTMVPVSTLHHLTSQYLSGASSLKS